MEAASAFATMAAMNFELQALPALRDNYIWLLAGRDAAVAVDPGEAAPVRAALTRRALPLAAVLLTHHHADHVGGAAELAAEHHCPVYGPAGERIGAVSRPLAEGQYVEIAALPARFRVIEVPGHTAGHIAYYGHDMVFCGDTLFSAGCGRLFEGTAAQMFASLERLAALPEDTAVCCGHEYTLANLRFAQAAEPGNRDIAAYAAEAAERRALGEPTLPSRIGRERRVNPFLRCRERTLRAAAGARSGRAPADAVEVFAVLRDWKDNFT